MRIVTNDSMKKIDTWATKVLGIPSIALMENAGRGCVDILEGYFDLEGLKVLVICGKGNNGGDGFVVARHLVIRGAMVKVILVGKGKELTGDALKNYRIAKKAKFDIYETTNIKTIKRIENSFKPHVVIDAIFGTGFKGAPQGIFYQIIEMITSSDAFVFSIDIPSGVNGDTGIFEKTCVIADATATMCLPKRGNFLYPGREFCGDLYVIDIGIPYSLINKGYPQIIEDNDIYHLMPYRPPDGNKGTFGQILIIAGARGYSGAAVMAALACLKVGAGLVRLAVPKGITNIVEKRALEVVKVPLPQTDQETISIKAIDTLVPLLEKSNVVVIGPGITTHDETARFLFSFLPQVKKPLIIDADAINIIARDKKFLKKIRAPFIITPHPGELARLIRMTPSQINEKRLDLAPKLAKDFNGVLVLKGAPTVVATPDGRTYVNPTGNSGLATAGSGDILVGMIAGFLAQKPKPLDASLLGTFLHGLCADLALDKNNEYSLLASDLLRCIPKSISYMLRREFEK